MNALSGLSLLSFISSDHLTKAFFLLGGTARQAARKWTAGQGGKSLQLLFGVLSLFFFLCACHVCHMKDEMFEMLCKTRHAWMDGRMTCA